MTCSRGPDLCHLHERRAEAESCAIDEQTAGQDRDVELAGPVRVEPARLGGPANRHADRPFRRPASDRISLTIHDTRGAP